MCCMCVRVRVCVSAYTYAGEGFSHYKPIHGPVFDCHFFFALLSSLPVPVYLLISTYPSFPSSTRGHTISIDSLLGRLSLVRCWLLSRCLHSWCGPSWYCLKPIFALSYQCSRDIVTNEWCYGCGISYNGLFLKILRRPTMARSRSIVNTRRVPV